MRKMTLVAALSAFSMPAIGADKAPGNDELYEIIKAQQEQIDQLVGQRGTSEGKTTIGGYGELHYNNFRNGRDQMDFHRFVLFFNHAFNDRVRFFSELELEHSLAGEGKPGEIELEQAYVEFDVTDNTRIKGGLFLIPIGILNETHEPTTFYGVERNPIESSIIPTTWWEGGAGISGNLGASGFSYDAAVHSGLDVKDSNYAIRGSRQKVASALAEDLAFSARLKYTGITGLEVAASMFYQSDMTQGIIRAPGTQNAITSPANVEGLLTEAHIRWNTGPLTLTALYARWDLNSDGPMVATTDLGPLYYSPEAVSRDVQDGYYVEGSWRFTEQLGAFVRHNEWDLGGAVLSPTGNKPRGNSEASQMNVGFNYWPHRNVVVKFDVQRQNAGAGDADGFNLGIGYQF